MAMVKFAMAQISGIGRSQFLLLPEAVEDDVGADKPVRCIDAFVEGLDLAAAGASEARAPLRVGGHYTARAGPPYGQPPTERMEGGVNFARR